MINFHKRMQQLTILRIDVRFAFRRRFTMLDGTTLSLMDAGKVAAPFVERTNLSLAVMFPAMPPKALRGSEYAAFPFRKARNRRYVACVSLKKTE